MKTFFITWIRIFFSILYWRNVWFVRKFDYKITYILLVVSFITFFFHMTVHINCSQWWSFTLPWLSSTKSLSTEEHESYWPNDNYVTIYVFRIFIFLCTLEKIFKNYVRTCHIHHPHSLIIIKNIKFNYFALWKREKILVIIIYNQCKKAFRSSPVREGGQII